jgi:hypothetical protein
MTNKQFLQSIYDTIYLLGIVQSQYEFGHLCGREDSWFSSAKSVNRPISTDALVSLAVSLEHLPQDRMPRGRGRKQVKELTRAIWLLVEAKAAGKA